VVEKIRQLGRVDGFKALFLEIVHELFEVLLTDVVHSGRLFLSNAVEHNDHVHSPRCGVLRIPFIVEVLAGIFDVGVRCVKRIQLVGRKCRRKGWRRTDSGGGRKGRVARGQSPRWLQLRERGLKGLRQRGADVWRGCRGGNSLAGSQEN